ncbi:MAG: thioredoxin domain-containing protein [Candidatus Uhrbacteria bacterium]|nr:thioredoxin domain-containing protein [Candidatus Uhrbacteria bacterium]
MGSKITFILAIISAFGVIILIFLFQAGDFNFDFLKDTSSAQPVVSTGITSALTTVSATDHTRGSENPDIIWIEYSDFECPYCKRFYPVVNQTLEKYGDRVQFIYRHFPFPTHVGAEAKAIASECVNEIAGEDAFWLFHDIMFEFSNTDGTGIEVADLEPIVGQIGINTQVFSNCLESGRYDDRVTTDLVIATQAGVKGTPTSFVIGPDGSVQVVEGAASFSKVESIIIEMLGDL